jgi:hypothetical protein
MFQALETGLTLSVKLRDIYSVRTRLGQLGSFTPVELFTPEVHQNQHEFIQVVKHI